MTPTVYTLPKEYTFATTVEYYVGKVVAYARTWFDDPANVALIAFQGVQAERRITAYQAGAFSIVSGCAKGAYDLAGDDLKKTIVKVCLAQAWGDDVFSVHVASLLSDRDTTIAAIYDEYQCSDNVINAAVEKAQCILVSKIEELVVRALDGDGRSEIDFGAVAKKAEDGTELSDGTFSRIVADHEKLTAESRKALIFHQGNTAFPFTLELANIIRDIDPDHASLRRLDLTNINGADLANYAPFLDRIEPENVQGLTFAQWAALPTAFRSKFIQCVADIGNLSSETIPKNLTLYEWTGIVTTHKEALTSEQCIALIAKTPAAQPDQKVPVINDLIGCLANGGDLNGILLQSFVMSYLPHNAQALAQNGYKYNWLQEVKVNNDSEHFLPGPLRYLPFGNYHRHFWKEVLAGDKSNATESGLFRFQHTLDAIANHPGCNLTREEIQLAFVGGTEHHSCIALDRLAPAFLRLGDKLTPDIMDGYHGFQFKSLLPILANHVTDRGAWAKALKDRK